MGRFRAEKGVVSTIHVKQLIDMAPRELWGDTLLDGVELMQPELAMFQFHYALSEAPRYPLAAGGTVSSCEASIMQDPESIFVLNSDDALGEMHLEDCALQVVHPAVFDAGRVPPGRGLLKIEGVAPYKLKEGPEHWDAIKEHVADTIVTHYFKHTSNLSKGKILAQFLLSPLHIERMNPAMWRGSVHHFDNRWGNFAPYRMPIPGLYQTGACTAPGGSISGIRCVTCHAWPKPVPLSSPWHLPASVIGVGAGAGSLVATHLPGDALRWIFCGFLAIIAATMLLPEKVRAHTAIETGVPTCFCRHSSD